MNQVFSKHLSVGRLRAISFLKVARILVPFGVVMTATDVAAYSGAPIVRIAETFLLSCVYGAYGFFTVRGMIRLAQDESQGFNFGFSVSLIAYLFVVSALAPESLHFTVVTPEKRIDWLVAGGLLLGTAWISTGVLLEREEETLQQAVHFQGAQPTVALILTRAVLLASRYCRNGLLFVFLATLLQLGGMVFEANPWMGEMLHLRSDNAADAAKISEPISHRNGLPKPLPC